MRAAAFVFVASAIWTAGCTDVTDQESGEPLAREPSAMSSPAHGTIPPDDNLLDVDLLPFGGGGTVATPKGGTSPCDLDAPDLQSWADQNLHCGTCYAMACGGEVRAHVCTAQCEDGLPST
jgi:hypothetical protein